MNHLVPDLSKDILPSKEAAGISLGSKRPLNPIPIFNSI